MNKRKWGPIIWNFIHVLSYKIKEESFEKQRNTIIKIINMVFTNLPCPNCSNHAGELLKKSNLKYIVDKESLINFLFSFHNNVNKRLKKNVFIRSKMDETYKNKSFVNALNDYINVYSSSHTNNLRFMLHHNYNQRIASKIINLIIENKNDYDP